MLNHYLLYRFLREALNLSRSVLSFKYVVHELIPIQPQYRGKKSDDMDWDVWNPDHMAKGWFKKVIIKVSENTEFF